MRAINSKVKYIETALYFLEAGDVIRLDCGCHAKMLDKHETNWIREVRVCEIVTSVCNIYNDLKGTPYYTNGHPIGKHLSINNNKFITKLIDY